MNDLKNGYFQGSARAERSKFCRFEQRLAPSVFAPGSRLLAALSMNQSDWRFCFPRQTLHNHGAIFQAMRCFPDLNKEARLHSLSIGPADSTDRRFERFHRSVKATMGMCEFVKTMKSGCPTQGIEFGIKQSRLPDQGDPQIIHCGSECFCNHRFKTRGLHLKMAIDRVIPHKASFIA